MRYKSAFRFLSAGLLACVLASMIVASCISKSPFGFSRQSAAIVIFSTLIGASLACADTFTSGMLIAAAYAVILSLLGPSPKLALLVVFLLGPLFGVSFQRYPIASVSLAGISLATLLALTSFRTTGLFVLLFVTVSILHQYSQAITNWLSAPFNRLRLHKNQLLAFCATYLGVATMFGLFFQTFYLISPGDSFSFSQEDNPTSFATYMYLSISALNSSLPSEIIPASTAAKLLLTLESLAGLFLLVVFIQFFLLNPPPTHEAPSKKRRS